MVKIKQPAPPGARAIRFGFAAAVLCGLSAAACSNDVAPEAPSDDTPELLGGGTTVFDTTRNAFTFAARNLDNEGRNAFALGSHFFNRSWVSAPASASGNDGLGPTFNAASCSACHVNEGRGAPPSSPDDTFLGLLMRLSVPGQDAHGGPLGDPNYGGQFNQLSILNVPREGNVSVRYEERPGAYADGEPYSLRTPIYTFSDLNFGPFGEGIMTSPRIAQVLVGLGLLEAISEETVRSRVDELDADGDGISGRANEVWSTRAGKAMLGRFGWKANQPNIEQQVADAFLGDIGITSELNPHQNCPSAQELCAAAPAGGTANEPELSKQKLTAITHWDMTIAVPARRNWRDPVVRQGEALFAEAKCTSCHVPLIETGELEGFPALSKQKIRPYTDLLLHDMGEGLADGRPDFKATGTEWRTAPLWGAGLIKSVNRHEFLLHDGRARGFAEAILWHGGEANASKDAFLKMSKAERQALLTFLADL